MCTNYGCPTYLWSEGVNTTTYFTNKYPSIANNGPLLKQIYNNSPHKINHLMIFGCLVYVLIPL